LKYSSVLKTRKFLILSRRKNTGKTEIAFNWNVRFYADIAIHLLDGVWLVLFPKLCPVSLSKGTLKAGWRSWLEGADLAASPMQPATCGLVSPNSGIAVA
jgi:hypothetical protein